MGALAKVLIGIVVVSAIGLGVVLALKRFVPSIGNKIPTPGG
jgi:hypothetical protein